MKKYVEFGIGNKWFVRTEFEGDDGHEIEHKGIFMPKRLESLYIRIWIKYTVIVIDSKEGIKKYKKSRKGFKFLLGLSGCD
ncbi:DUF3977 family protein [Paenibacillus medicaginis]|uniref:DUF3977 family protein n=1 Tax=Paenibacillus medicaginis TaxID=1470560 RepID=A0ABV5C2Y8_9BACL